MRLADLNPRWALPPNWSWPDRPFYPTISFDCPCAKCRAPACPTCGHAPDARRLAVSFYPPIDPTGVASTFASPWPDLGHHHRRVSGETFDTLTLSPSIGFESIGHWHGHVTNGEVTTS